MTLFRVSRTGIRAGVLKVKTSVNSYSNRSLFIALDRRGGPKEVTAGRHDRGVKIRSGKGGISRER